MLTDYWKEKGGGRKPLGTMEGEKVSQRILCRFCCTLENPGVRQLKPSQQVEVHRASTLYPKAAWYKITSYSNVI